MLLKSLFSRESIDAINDELWCLENNDEDQKMVDTRFAIIFQEIASLLEGQGETLFVKLPDSDDNSDSNNN